MGQRVVHDCDRCGGEIKSDKILCRISLCTGSQLDGAGDTDYNYEQVELCPNCTALSLIALISEVVPKSVSYDRAKEMIRYLRKPSEVNLRNALRK